MSKGLARTSHQRHPTLVSIPAACIAFAALAFDALALQAPAAAEVTSLSGSASVSVQQFTSNIPTAPVSASGAFPAQPLPIQVVASIDSTAAENLAAAVIAAQFEDPNLSGGNPSDFAVNAAFNSLSPNVFFRGQALLSETRGILFTSSEIGARDGTNFTTEGKVFLDGAFAIFATNAGTNLSTSNIAMNVTVVLQRPGQDDATVFEGSLTFSGTADGSVQASAGGALPVTSLVLADLTPFVPQYGVFEMLIIPRLVISYRFPSTVGQEFSLVASVQLNMTQTPNAGIAAVLGTPVNAISQVITNTQGTTTAQKVLEAIEDERADPTGEPAFPQPTPRPTPLFPLCGPIGLEAALGLAALSGLRWGVRGRRAAPRE